MGSYTPPPLPPAPPPGPDLTDQAVRAARRMQLAQALAGQGRASTFLGGGAVTPTAAPTTRKPLLGG